MMYLFDSYPIVVSRELATIIGLNEAIVLQQVHYWVQKNKENDTNFFEGNYWTFNTVKEWHEKNFPFFSTNTIIRTFAKLEKMNLIKVRNFNKESRNQTKWYTINYDELEK